MPFFDFVSVDSDVAVCGRLTEEDILSHVRHGDQQSEPDDANDEQDEEEEEEEPPRPSASDALAALQIVERYFTHEENAEHALGSISVLQRIVLETRFKRRTQGKITDYFSK